MSERTIQAISRPGGAEPGDSQPARRQRARRGPVRWAASVGIQLPLLAMAVGVLFPLYFMVANSLKTDSAFARNSLAVPLHPTLAKYGDALHNADLGRFFVNTLVISVVAVAATTICAALGSFAFAKMQFAGREWLFRTMLPTMAVPAIVLLVPQFTLMSRLGLINSRWSVIFLYVGIMLPMSLYLLRNFFVAFPDELLQAAVLDGLGAWGILLRIVLPCSRPALFTVVVINFVFAWNELLLALVFLQNEGQRTLVVGITVFSGLYSLDVPELMAGMTIATAPVVLLYLFGQRYLMRGLLGGVGK